MRALTDGLWVADRTLKLLGTHLPIRMTVIRLSDGGLWLHSPVKLDAPTRKSLDALGPVRHVVAPNLVHHLFARAYFEAYPDARILACPGLAGKRKDLSFHGVLSDQPPGAWAGEIDQHLLQGIPYLQEVDFFHAASRTLVLTDLVFHAEPTTHLPTRIFYHMTGTYLRFGPSRLVKLLMRDKAAVRKSIDRILEWDFDRVVMNHGAVVEKDGRARLRDAFAWIGP